MPEKSQGKLVIVTGMSGAGKTVAIQSSKIWATLP